MSGRIPENILEDILSRVDIVELISGYIPLKRSGRNFKANCPFHQEKTPSFMVSSDRQIYHCFGCGESGNAFKFLMQHERLEFLEAVETLAKKTGVVLPQVRSNDDKTTSFFAQLFKVNELAGIFYEQNLESQAGLAAKNYFSKRGLSADSIKLFKLGFALDKWDGLINFLREKNINIGLLDKAGLVLAKSGGGYYDRFRNRMIFPIFDIKSKVLGFGARVLDNSLPKYVNSPETPIYTKGKNLYGLNFSKDAIKELDYALIVEGYLDFIIPFQAGIKNIIASSGTALTQDQVRLLKRYTHNVVMVYDGDSAGEIAALRSLDIFIDEGLNVKVVSLPGGFDPDSFVRKFGPEAFKEKIKNAQNLFDYKLGVLKSRFNAKEIEGKANIASEMLVTLNKISNTVLKTEYIRKLSDEIDVKEEALIDELGKLKKEDKPDYYQVQAAPKKAININPTEKLLIKLMLEETELINHIRNHLTPADFQDELTSKIVSTMFSLAEQGRNIDTAVLVSHLGDEDVSRIVCESAFLPEVSSEQKEDVVNDCIKRLKNEKIRVKKQLIHDQIKDAQYLGDEDKINRLMQEFHLLIKKG